jgi:hypothetical protein
MGIKLGSGNAVRVDLLVGRNGGDGVGISDRGYTAYNIWPRDGLNIDLIPMLVPYWGGR